LPGQNQYEYESATLTWRLLGAATGAVPGCYGDAFTVPTFCVDAQGRITSVTNVAIASNTPDLQQVTTQGAVTTDTIDVGGLVAANLIYPLVDGTANQVMTTDGAGNLGWTTAGGGSVGTLQTVTDNGSTTTNSITVAGLNVSGVSTFSQDIKIAQGYNAYFGSGNELGINYNGLVTNIESTTKDLYITGNGYDRAVFRYSGAAELYYNDILRFETNANGARVAGTATVDQLEANTNVFLGISNFSTCGLILGGTAQTAKLFYNAASTRNQFTGTNTDFYIRAKNYTFATGPSGPPAEIGLTITEGGSVALYYSNIKKVETSAVGATVTGDLDVTGLLSASGLDYPLSDGAANQVMSTDGAGNLGWITTAKVVATPGSSGAGGADNEISFDAAGNFYFFKGGQWWKVAGVSF
jgi:hypothetical protein